MGGGQLLQEPVAGMPGMAGMASAAPVGTVTLPSGQMVAPGTIHIQVEGAHGLRDADVLPGGGKSDPYAVIQLQGKPHTRFQTDVVNNTADPVWNIEADVPGY